MSLWVSLHGAMVSVYGTMVSLHGRHVEPPWRALWCHGEPPWHPAEPPLSAPWCHGEPHYCICCGAAGRGRITPLTLSETTVWNNSFSSCSATNKHRNCLMEKCTNVLEQSQQRSKRRNCSTVVLDLGKDVNFQPEGPLPQICPGA
jgi:hypothetical protein